MNNINRNDKISQSKKGIPTVKVSDVGNSKLLECDVIKIRHLYENISSQRGFAPRIAKEYNVSIDCIRHIINRKTWKHI